MRSLTGGNRETTLSVLLLCALLLVLPGCQNSGGLTSASLSPAPTTPGALVTNSWAYESGGKLVTVDGEWVHLPAGQAGELLLWVEHAEATCP